MGIIQAADSCGRSCPGGTLCPDRTCPGGIIRVGSCFPVLYKFHMMECPRFANVLGWQLSYSIYHGSRWHLSTSFQYELLVRKYYDPNKNAKSSKQVSIGYKNPASKISSLTLALQTFIVSDISFNMNNLHTKMDTLLNIRCNF